VLGWEFTKTFSARFVIYGLLISFALGAFVAYRVHKRLDALAEQKSQKDVIVRVVRIQEATRKIEEKHLEAEEKRIEANTVAKAELPKYAEPEKDPFCNVPVGAVRVLNAARDRGATADSVSATARASHEEAQAPSTITRDALIEDNRRLAEMYNELANQCEALIDFTETVQRNLRRRR